VDFKKYWQAIPVDQRAAFAARVESTEGYLEHIATGYRKASAARLVPAIVRETKGMVTREDLRPDVFGPPKALRAAAATTSQRVAAGD
jgi:DNA-binding transcriptional regulator YdaS (Cro superfamily)